jgi:hypothetical protein
MVDLPLDDLMALRVSNSPISNGPKLRARFGLPHAS